MLSNVLIVDDDPDIQILFESVFDFYNISPVKVATLSMAKNELDKFIPQLMVLDNSLPDGKGVEFIDFLNEKYPCIRIILFTGDRLNIYQNNLNEKILMYVEKPSIQPILNIIKDENNWMKCDKAHKCFSQNCYTYQ